MQGRVSDAGDARRETKMVPWGNSAKNQKVLLLRISIIFVKISNNQNYQQAAAGENFGK